MKRIICLLLALIILLPTVVFAYDKPISVTLDGEKLAFDVEPALIDGRTMVPIRAIFEAMGAVVEWDNDTQSAICTKGDTVVKMTIDSPTIYINNVSSQMDTSPVIINGRTLAPARFVAESFGYKVEWDNENAIAKITSVVSEPEKETDVEKDTFVIDMFDKSAGSFYIPYQSGLPELGKRGIEFQENVDSEIVYVKLESKASLVTNKSYSKEHENIGENYNPNYLWLTGTINVKLTKAKGTETMNLGDLIKIENFYSEYGMPIKALYYKFTNMASTTIKNLNDLNKEKEADMSKIELKRGDDVTIQYSILTDSTEKDEYPVFRILYDGGEQAKYMHLMKGTSVSYRNNKYTKAKPQSVQITLSKEECEAKIKEIKDSISTKKEELNVAFSERNENKATDIQNKILALELELKKYEDHLKTLE